jgi:hypothetical protein
VKIGLLVLAGLLASASAASAQQTAGACPPPRSLSLLPDSAKPDIAIVARVQAAELRFNAQPSTSLQITGCPQIDTSLVVMRTNLPTPVQPGVTYRNIVVDFKLHMKLAELECILAGKPCAAPKDSVR